MTPGRNAFTTHMSPHASSGEDSASGHDKAGKCVSTMDSGTDLLQCQAEPIPIMEKSGTYPCRHHHILNEAGTMGVLAARTPLSVVWVVLVPPQYDAVRMLTCQAGRMHVWVILLSRIVRPRTIGCRDNHDHAEAETLLSQDAPCP